MQIFTADHDGIQIDCLPAFGSTDDPLLLIMGIGAEWQRSRSGRGESADQALYLASPCGRRGGLASVRTMTEKGGA